MIPISLHSILYLYIHLLILSGLSDSEFQLKNKQALNLGFHNNNVLYSKTVNYCLLQSGLLGD